MRIVYCGNSEFGIKSLRQIAVSSHQLVHIITHPAKPAGRGKKLRPNPVAQWAKEKKIAFTEITDSNSSEGIELLKKLSPELLVVIAYGQKISQEFISIPLKGAINVHASLLPKYRGAAPINRAIIDGQKQTGVSIITLADEMDAGFVLASAKIDILPEDTAGSLRQRLADLAPPVLLETIDKIAAGTAEYKKQDNSLATSAPKLKKSDGIIDWSLPAEQIHNRVRGLWPWPAAVSDFCSARIGSTPCRVILAETEPVRRGRGGKSGSVDENLNVICGQNSLKIVRLKPRGGKLMDFKSFINGRGTGRGNYFSTIKEKDL